jgi:N6-L-threonylcarbamoyladenine synthase
MRDNICIALSTRTQLEHDVTGGVVPEVAARSHANAIFPCIDDALSEAQITLQDIDSIACTEKPGLLPSLLTGMTVAKTLALALEKPLIWVDHIEAHMFANLLERDISDIVFPSVVLTVSGGHTEIYLWKSLFEFELLGQTRDDAAGEAYDKVAKMMGLGFPGGAKVAKLADSFRHSASVNEIERYRKLFPRSFLESDSLDFSFSGLKSAVKRYIDSEFGKQDSHEAIAFAFEEAVVDVLISKLFQASSEFGNHQIYLAGWVSANIYLKEQIEIHAKKTGIQFFAPMKLVYSQDNAAMVGMYAYMKVKMN